MFSLTGITVEGGVMDAVARLARSREIAGNLVHVPQRPARGTLDSHEKRMCRALGIGGNHSPGARPFAASLTPWRNGHEGVEPEWPFLRYWDTGLASAVHASPDLPRSAGRRNLKSARIKFVCIVYRLHFYAFEYRGRLSDCIRSSRQIELAKAT